MTVRVGILFALLCVFWGIPYFFIKLALVDVPPAGVAWGRITLGALVLLPVAWRRGSLREVMNRKTAILAFAVTELVIPFALIAYAEKALTSSIAGVLIATVPMTIVLLAPMFGVHERLGARRLLGLLVGLIGVVVLLGFDAIETRQQWLAVAALAAAIMGYAVGPLIVQRQLVGVDEIAAVAASLGVASVVLLPFALATLPPAVPAVSSMGYVAVLGLICTAGALLLYFYVIHAAGAARASIVAYVSPAIAALLGVAVLHERFTTVMAAGLGLILVGSALGTART